MGRFFRSVVEFITLTDMWRTLPTFPMPIKRKKATSVRIVYMRIDSARILILYYKGGILLPKKPMELERIIFADGWIFKSQNGSHRQYIHPTKPGKVTIPFHTKELPIKTEKSILKQAGLI